MKVIGKGDSHTIITCRESGKKLKLVFKDDFELMGFLGYLQDNNLNGAVIDEVEQAFHDKKRGSASQAIDNIIVQTAHQGVKLFERLDSKVGYFENEDFIEMVEIAESIEKIKTMAVAKKLRKQILTTSNLDDVRLYKEAVKMIEQMSNDCKEVIKTMILKMEESDE